MKFHETEHKTWIIRNYSRKKILYHCEICDTEFILTASFEGSKHDSILMWPMWSEVHFNSIFLPTFLWSFKNRKDLNFIRNFSRSLGCQLMFLFCFQILIRLSIYLVSYEIMKDPWCNLSAFQKRRGQEYRESRGNREGDGIWAAGSGSGRDRAGTLPAEG